MIIIPPHVYLFILALSDNCFTGDTLVAAENGQIRIDEIEVGDKVWAYDIFTGETAPKEVTKVYVHEVDEILHLHTSCGDIDTTTNHPFYVIDRGWVAAGDLVHGDEILTIDGSVAVITGSEIEKLDETILVYNLEVADFNTYFVGDVPVLVHNYEVAGKGHTGRTEPDNLVEQMHMESVLDDPLDNATLLDKIKLNDSRWPHSEGWRKYQSVLKSDLVTSTIHFVYNIFTNVFDDFKFKN